MFGHKDFYTIKNADEDEDGLIRVVMLPLRDKIIFPGMTGNLVIKNEKELTTIATAHAEQSTIITLLPQFPGNGFHKIGVEVAPGRLLNMPDGSGSLPVQGRRRIEVVKIEQESPFFEVTARPVAEVSDKTRPIEALMRAVLTLFERCVKMEPRLTEDVYLYAMNIESPGELADLIASHLNLTVIEHQEILEKISPVERLHRVSALLGRELDILDTEARIENQVQSEVDRAHREIFLREKMRAIQNELGEIDIFQQEMEELHRRIEEAGLPAEIYDRANRELSRLSMMPPIVPEAGIIRNYLENILELPWEKATEDNLDIPHAAAILETNHYGLRKVKDRILEHLAVRRLASDKMRSPILCFIGPPGTGKTSAGKSIAEALGREFVRISLGGVHDEAEIRGHRRTYIGALPGRILSGMRRAGTVNPVFVMDEIDKLGKDFRGDPASALLEVLDPEQNFAFSDHYLELPYDLSRVFFITTANALDTIPSPLLDRMEVIEFPGYSEEEKLEIARRFLVPRQLDEHGLGDFQLQFDDDALKKILYDYTREAGVRNFDREIAGVCRKLARQVAEDNPISRTVKVTAIYDYLGAPHYHDEAISQEDQVGVVNGMAWNSAGGDLLAIEVTLVPGDGKLVLTGKLGDVMQESARAALSYLKSRAENFKIDLTLFTEKDIHLHVPAGAIPKDGPSAGISIALALMSAFTGRKVRHDIALTGEITLRGRILPVGGIRAKILAAHRNKVFTVLIPIQNDKDLAEFEAESQVIREMTVIKVQQMDEVIQHTLLPLATSASGSRSGRVQQPPLSHNPQNPQVRPVR